MVAEGHRLGGLQVGEARHQRLGMRLRLASSARCRAPRAASAPSIAASRTQQRKSSRDLVVARARGVQPPGRLADQLPSRLSTFMWMSSSARENGKVPAAISSSIGRSPRGSSRRRPGDDALGRQHRGVRAGARDVLRARPVEADGDVDRLHQLGRLAEKRPPHILLAFLSVTGTAFRFIPGLLEPQGASQREKCQLTLLGRRNCREPRFVTSLGAAAIAAVAGFASVYVTLGRPDNAVRPPARDAPARVSEASVPTPSGPGANALSQGQMAAFVFRKAPEDLPEVQFQDAAGKERTLADWRGKVVLRQLVGDLVPALPQGDAGARPAAAGDGLRPLRGGGAERRPHRLARRPQVPRRDQGGEARPLRRRHRARSPPRLRAAGLPATLLIDRDGREIGRLLGPAEWDGEDAKRLIRWALK